MGVYEEVETKTIEWSEEVEALYSRFLPEEDQRFVQTMLERPDYRLLGVYHAKTLRCVFILRADTSVQGRDLAVFMGAGQLIDFDLTAYVLNQVCDLAQAMGFKNVYFNTKRQGLIKKAEKAGFKYMETIMRKKVA